jgi:hypothetical protein
LNAENYAPRLKFAELAPFGALENSESGEAWMDRIVDLSSGEFAADGTLGYDHVDAWLHIYPVVEPRTGRHEPTTN